MISSSNPSDVNINHGCRDTVPVRDSIGMRITHRISDECAVNAIDSYAVIVNTITNCLPDSMSKKVIYGAYVDKAELRQVVVHEHFNEYDSLFIMIGEIDAVPELIFTLQSNDPSKENLYFDFTLPCPNQCPKAFPHNIEIPDINHGCRDTVPVRDSIGMRITHRISDECAVNAIDSYAVIVNTIINCLPDSMSEKIIYGAYVDKAELRQVVVHEHFNEYDSLFIMIGEIDAVPELIFTLQSNNPSKENLYFDFTLPCPNQCPKAFPSIRVKN